MRLAAFLFVLVFPGVLISQESGSERVGIHQLQSDYYSAQKSAGEPISDAAFPQDLNMAESAKLSKVVLGWHPYWTPATAHEKYDYNSLSHIAYFSYEVDTATGGYTTIHDWNTTPLISYAHQRGTKVLLTVTNFGSARNTELLTDTMKQINLLNTVIALIKNRNGDGVNFDLESVSSSQRTNLVNFMNRASRMIRAQLPAAEISMAAPAVDWSNSWNLWALSNACDYLIIMGYDYYWKGSATAGPVAPLSGEPYNVTKSVDTYLNLSVPPGKLMLGVPWYGYDWPVVSSDIKAKSTGNATARVYTAAESLAMTYGSNYDNNSQTPWVPYYYSSAWHQLWYDDARSLGQKYNLVNNRKIAGIGIWALGYEDGSEEIWGKIFASFTKYEGVNDMILNIYPNPVSESASLLFRLNERGSVTIELFDTFGKKIKVLLNSTLDAGTHERTFDITGLGSGVYLCVMRSQASTHTRKIVITK